MTSAFPIHVFYHEGSSEVFRVFMTLMNSFYISKIFSFSFIMKISDPFHVISICTRLFNPLQNEIYLYM